MLSTNNIDWQAKLPKSDCASWWCGWEYHVAAESLQRIARKTVYVSVKDSIALIGIFNEERLWAASIQLGMHYVSSQPPMIGDRISDWRGKAVTVTHIAIGVGSITELHQMGRWDCGD